MAITYELLNQRQEKWGIDVTVEFLDDETGKKYTKTFGFKTQGELDSEYVARMAKAISNIEDDIAEQALPTERDITDELEKYFEENETISKEDFESIKTTGKVPDIIVMEK